MQVFEGNNASEVWNQAAVSLCALEEGGSTFQPSRAGATREILHAALVIRNPQQRWVLTRPFPISPAFALAEVVWILAGRNDAAFLNYWNPKLPQYAGHVDTYHGAYGFRLRRHFGLDQLERAYHALRNNPDTRQVVLQLWDVEIDFPSEDGSPTAPDVPCNIVSLLKIRGGKLEWMQIIRSNDLFRGVPYNFIQFTSLQEVLAGWLGVGVGSYTQVSDSLHIYERDTSCVFPPLVIEAAENTDSLEFSKDVSDRSFALLNKNMQLMTVDTLTRDDLRELALPAGLPQGFYNLLLVAAADAARRRKWFDDSKEFMAENTNPALRQVWHQWAQHKSKSKH